jgi:hypothetical protein
MVVFTGVLFIAAIGFALMAWWLWRQERERSHARVAALAVAIDGPSATGWPGELDQFGSERAQAPSIFQNDRPSVVQGHPLIKVAIGLVMAVAVIVIIAMTSVKREAPPTLVKAPDSTLELLSMSHSREGDTLTVTGLVRNSGDGPAQGITAVVFAFDRNGGFVTSGRSRLDDSTVGPGEESPFQVVIPKVKDVGRYRVSFRTEAGVVKHVDRRSTGLRAAN